MSDEQDDYAALSMIEFSVSINELRNLNKLLNCYQNKIIQSILNHNLKKLQQSVVAAKLFNKVPRTTYKKSEIIH